MRYAEQYYMLIEEAFRELCPERAGFMNMGLWPAATLRAAQAGLVRALVEARLAGAGPASPPVRGVIDVGCGFGAAARVYQEALGGVRYLGLNSSASQLAVAAAAGASPGIAWQQVAAEDFAFPAARGYDAVFSVEAFFHVEDKATVLRRMAANAEITSINLAEISVEAPAAIGRSRLLARSLGAAWSVAAYEQALAALGFAVRVTAVSEPVLGGICAYLAGPDVARRVGRGLVQSQIRRGFDEMRAAAARGELAYVLIVAER